MASIKKHYTDTPKIKYTPSNFFAGLYVALMFTVFPLFLSNYYGRVRRDKFWVLIILTTVTSVIIAAIYAYNLFISKKNKKKLTTSQGFKFSICDYSFFAFFIISAISTFTTKHGVLHSLTGYTNSNPNAGRSMGLIMYALLFIMYLIISRQFYFKPQVFGAIFAGGAAVTLLAIVNYYYIDPLGLFKYYTNDPMVTINFTSTLGNKNYLSAFVCVLLPFSVGVAMTSQNKKTIIAAHISTAIQFMGLLVATSDGGFLGLIALVFITPVLISREPLKLAKFFFSLTVMALSANTLRLFDLIMGGNSKGYIGISQVFMSGYLSLVLVVVFALLTAIFVFLHIKRGGKMLPKYVFYAVLSVAVLVALSVVSVIVYYTFINKDRELTGFKAFLRFNDDWGTHRGFFWKRSLNIWKYDFNLWQKLFGSGPETFYASFEPYFAELYNRYTEGSSNAAHNVYVNMLITHGVLGLLSYITIIAVAILKAIKNSFKNPLAFVCLLVLITYVCQDFVNIANPINTPLFFVFISLSAASDLPQNTQQQLAKSEF
ncbi:MAG: O-antigen ligase family protein [Clostridia bacterium]|nr:O-antigen ligase family protein [Clostridia bacterium]